MKNNYYCDRISFTDICEKLNELSSIYFIVRELIIDMFFFYQCNYFILLN